MAYMLVAKNICLRDLKSRNYCPRKHPGACHGDDFGLVENGPDVCRTVFVSSFC